MKNSWNAVLRSWRVKQTKQADDFWFWVFDVNLISSKETLIWCYILSQGTTPSMLWNPKLVFKLLKIIKIREKFVKMSRTVLLSGITFSQTFTAFWQFGKGDTTHLTKIRRMENRWNNNSMYVYRIISS